jgi:signal transduction histidine kinase
MALNHYVANHRKWILILIGLTPIAADLGSSIFFPSSFWYQFIPGLYYVGIVIAGLEFGWKNGLGVALIAGIAHSTIALLLLRSPFTQLGPQALAFLIVGFALVDESRRRWRPAEPAPETPPQFVQTKDCLAQVSTIAQELLREIRTPFASIEGAAFMVGDESTSRDKRHEFLDIIVDQCKRINGVLRNIEECTETVELACHPTDASSMLSEVIRLAALEHPDPAISLRIEVASDLPRLWCDPARIQQAMVPFVTSAMQAMHGGGEILLAADRQNGHGRIQLRVLGQTVRGSDPALGRGSFSSTFNSPTGPIVLAAYRTAMQHGGTILLDQTGSVKKLLSLTLPLYTKQTL